MKIETIEISKLKPNGKNPRKISKIKLEGLKKSLADFPEMLNLRPLVIDAKNKILAGNQRYTALVALDKTHVPVIRAENLSAAQIKEFVVKDNTHYGEWDFEGVEKDWDVEDLSAWGVPRVSISDSFTEIGDVFGESRLNAAVKIKLGDVVRIGKPAEN